MAGQPWIKFWVGDWRKDPDVALLSAETKGVWLEMIWAMHEKDTYKLTGTLLELSLMAGCREDEVKRAIAELKRYNVAKVCHNKSVTVTVTSRKRHADVLDRDKARLRKQQQRVRDGDTIDDTAMSQSSHSNVTLSDSDSDSVSNVFNKKNKVNFSPPTLEDCLDRCDVKGFDHKYGEGFFEHYDENGWMRGRNPMRDWKKSLTMWHKKRNEYGTEKKSKGSRLTARQLGSLSYKESLEHGGFDTGTIRVGSGENNTVALSDEHSDNTRPNRITGRRTNRRRQV